MTLRPGLPEEQWYDPSKPKTKARPQKYTDALRDTVLKLIIGGNNPKTAATAAGLPDYMYNAWKADVANGSAHPDIVDLFEDIDRAYAGCEVRMVGVISKSFDDSAISPAAKVDNAFKFLKNTRQKDWSEQTHIIVQNEMSLMFEALETEFSDEPQILSRVYKRLSSGK